MISQFSKKNRLIVFDKYINKYFEPTFTLQHNAAIFFQLEHYVYLFCQLTLNETI